MAKRSIEMPTAPLRDLLAWWRTSKVSGAIIGGLAVGLVGKPRVTRDVDAVVVIDDDRWESFWRVGQSRGFVSRISDPLVYAKQSRMLVLVHKPSAIEVDVALAGIPFENDVVKRAQVLKVGRLSVPVARPDDLVVYKAVAGRPIDLGDISSLIEHYPDIDLAYIRKQVNEFAAMLGITEPVDELERLIAYHRGRKAK